MAYDEWFVIDHGLSAISHLARSYGGAFLHRQLDPSYAERVAIGQMRLRDTPAVHERAVRAFQIDHFELVGRGGYPAMQPRHQCGVDDEVGARGAADGFDGAGPQAKRGVGLGTLQDPHQAISYRCQLKAGLC